MLGNHFGGHFAAKSSGLACRTRQAYSLWSPDQNHLRAVGVPGRRMPRLQRHVIRILWMVGPARCCPPGQRTALGPSRIELIGIL